MVKTFRKEMKKLIMVILVFAGFSIVACSDILSDLDSENNEVLSRTEIVLNGVPVVVHKDYSSNNNYDVEEEVQSILTKEILNSNPDKFSRLIVDISSDRKNKTLQVFMLSKDTTDFEFAEIVLDENYKIESIEQGRDFLLQTAADDRGISDLPYNSGSKSYSLSQAQFVFSTCEESLQTAIAAVERAYEIAIAAGYRAVKLIGAAENRQNIQSLLNSPYLIGWGRVGHGNEVGIVLDDGALYYTYFNSLSPVALNNKVLFFDSCNVSNPPLEDSILQAGVQKFIGGNRQLAIGPSEEVFKSFWDKVITDKSSIVDSLNASQIRFYFSTSAFGISGEGPDFISGQ